MRISDWSSDVCSSDLMANSMDERTFACQKPNVHGCVEKNTSPLLYPCSLALIRGKSALASQIHPLARGDGVDILVAAARQVAQDDRVLRHVARQLDGLGDGVAGLERGEEIGSAPCRERVCKYG